MQQDILVLGNFKQTLTVIRSLARAGYRVILGRNREKSWLECSRHVDAIWTYTATTPAGFLDELEAWLQARPGPTLIFPIGEATLERLARASPRFQDRALIVMAQPEVVLACLDKRGLYARAQALGIPLPPTAGPYEPAAWVAQAAAWGYPCIVKRNTSFQLVQDSKAMTLRTEAELRAFLATPNPAPDTLLLQQRIDGHRRNGHFLAADGEILLYFEQKVLRTDQVDGSGYGVEGVSVAPTAALREHAGRLVQSLGYSGIGCAQFLVDGAGRGYFLELNPRLDATVALPYRCGVDIPRLAVEWTLSRAGLGEPPRFPAEYPVGRGAAWLIGDLIGWVRALRYRRIRPGQSLHWGLCLLRSPFRNRYHMVWELTDPLPALCMLRAWLTGSVQRTLRCPPTREPPLPE